MNQEALNKLDQYAQRLGIAAEKLFTYVVQGVRIDIVGDTFGFLVGVGFGVFAGRGLLKKARNDKCTGDIDAPFYGVVTVALVIVGAILMCVCFDCAIGDIFAPEAKAIAKIAGMLK